MPHTALYRKKRPQTFGAVVGQPHVVRTLLNQLTAGHISHAYLFCGTRGTGKTTTARLFARAVNCQNPQNGEPCNACEVCLDILAERNLDVVELDAASNNGVDNIRDLREEVKYPPTECKYKVYIIDEVHMLSGSAFNALLKTLEEPPPHVIFILATTDPQKLPPTIISRCQRYDFKRLSAREMTAAIRGYLTEENAPVDDDALRYIVSVSDGAMRDALSILEQCLSLYRDETLTLDKTLALLGAADRRLLYDFTGALTRFDGRGALAVIDAAARDGCDFSQLCGDLIKHFRDLLVCAYITDDDLLEQTAENAEKLRAQRKNLSDETLTGYIYAFSELLNEMRYAFNARMALEVCALKLCYRNGAAVMENTQPAGQQEAVIEQPSVNHERPITAAGQPAAKKRKKTVKPNISDEPDIPDEPVTADEPIIPDEPVISDEPALISPFALMGVQNNWAEFCAEFTGLTKSMLLNCAVGQSGELLQIVCGDEGTLNVLKDKKETILKKLIARFALPESQNIAFIVGDGYNNLRAPDAGEQDDWSVFTEQGEQIGFE